MKQIASLVWCQMLNEKCITVIKRQLRKGVYEATIHFIRTFVEFKFLCG